MTPLPPKQGLKPQHVNNCQVNQRKVMTPLPPKQGLKHLWAIQKNIARRVMTPLPPKQGLKRISHIRIVRVILRL